MQIDCEAVRESIDAWALGALDATEARALEGHIAGCAECALLADDANEAAASLALAVPLVSADPSLKARVMTSASLAGQAPVRTQQRWWFAAAAAAFVFGIGAVSWGGYLQTQVNDLNDREARVGTAATAQSNQFATMRTELVQASASNVSLASNQDAMLKIVSHDDVQRLPMAGTEMAPKATGRYIWSREGGLGALVATHLPPLPAGMSYCMWVVYENAWTNNGLFTVDESGSGRLIVRNLDDAPADRGAFRGFAVTVEPSTGAATHTGGTVLKSAALN
jgi:anti-sigma-K factor RskA